MASNHSTGRGRPVNHPDRRRLKVCEGYHSYQLAQAVHERSPVAQIQLKGNWLHQAGFTVDTPVQVRIMRGCLVLIAEPPKPPRHRLRLAKRRSRSRTVTP